MPDFKTHGCRALFLGALLVLAPPLAAQDAGSCSRTPSSDGPAREIFICGDALTFEREPTAALRILERATDPAPRFIEVENGALFIDVSPGSSATRIRTPHAIATVRGTTYVVDAQIDQTSVFVVKGEVKVQRQNDASSVTLRAGDGVDVALNEPLTVRRWGAGRVTALLSRFGR